jgi:two-component system response regulator FixJ
MPNTAHEIAVVDDDDAIRDSFRFMLELAGFLVATYASGLEFLASDLARTRCLILDHHMPIMTGLDLVVRLHAAQIRLPIMMITSAPSTALITRAKALGITSVLEKPPTEDELLRFVAIKI